jgi:heme/copper-type cytochrome/quinol oxidase subunit 2
VPRNLAVDNEILVPVGKVVHVLVTSTDVIHNWTIPSFGSKVDAVPGRVTATWFQATKEGIYFGQCSELCGKDHAFMPIAVRVVKEQTFNDWAAALKARDRKKGARDHPQRGGRARGSAEGRGREPSKDKSPTACPRRAVAHKSRSLSGGADRNCEGRRHGNQDSRGTRARS